MYKYTVENLAGKISTLELPEEFEEMMAKAHQNGWIKATVDGKEAMIGCHYLMNSIVKPHSAEKEYYTNSGIYRDERRNRL